MRELTSSFDDVEKRLGIFIGLGAFLFSSLLCLIRGATFETYIIQGAVLALVFGLVGYGYGHWIRNLVKANVPEEGLDKENVEFRHVDAQTLAEEVVSAGDVPETVIEDSENGGAGISSFEMPQFDETEEPGAPPRVPSAMAPPPPPPAPATVMDAADSGEDLPPPPVPSGA